MNSRNKRDKWLRTTLFVALTLLVAMGLTATTSYLVTADDVAPCGPASSAPSDGGEAICMLDLDKPDTIPVTMMQTMAITIAVHPANELTPCAMSYAPLGMPEPDCTTEAK